MMMQRYIRSKANPTEILAFGYVEPGGLGTFDADQFEEVEGDLPAQWTSVNMAQATDPFMTALASIADPEGQLAVLRLRSIYEQAILLKLPSAISAIETQLAALLTPELSPDASMMTEE